MNSFRQLCKYVNIMNTEKHKDNPLYGFMHLHVQMHYLSISTAMQHLIVIVKCLIKEIILFHKYHLVILFSFNHIICSENSKSLMRPPNCICRTPDICTMQQDDSSDLEAVGTILSEVVGVISHNFFR